MRWVPCTLLFLLNGSPNDISSHLTPRYPTLPTNERTPQEYQELVERQRAQILSLTAGHNEVKAEARQLRERLREWEQKGQETAEVDGYIWRWQSWLFACGMLTPPLHSPLDKKPGVPGPRAPAEGDGPPPAPA